MMIKMGSYGTTSLLMLLAFLTGNSRAFTPKSIILRHQSLSRHNEKCQNTKFGVLFSTTSNNGNMSNVEALLAKARALRAEAEAAETELHTALIEKKTSKDTELDALIEQMFPIDRSKDDDVAARALSQFIEEKRLSSERLVQVVERLHNREIAAKGLEHVQSSLHHTHVKFERVADPDEKELARVNGLIDLLINAATILDEKFLKNQIELRGENGKVVMHNVDHSHWATGELRKVLSEKSKFLGREHDEQFKHRLEEYYEAARKKNVSQSKNKHP